MLILLLFFVVPCFSSCFDSVSLPVHYIETPVVSPENYDACVLTPTGYGVELFDFSNVTADETDAAYAPFIPPDCLANPASANISSLFFDFTTGSHDWVEYRISLVAGGSCGVQFSSPIGAMAFTILPSCALDATPLLCTNSSNNSTSNSANSSVLLDLVVPHGVLKPETMYRIRVHSTEALASGCFAACIVAHKLPDSPPNIHCDTPMKIAHWRTLLNPASEQLVPFEPLVDSPSFYLPPSVPFGSNYEPLFDQSTGFWTSILRTARGVPTAFPSLIPTTKKPTAKPTMRFTLRPTSKPTLRPTVPLTRSPTSKPTAAVTKSPTNKPTAAVITNSPTNNPTVAVTKSPTSKPTAAITSSPTNKPTVAITNSPTNKPTVAITNSPTSKPTAAVTNSPTNKPTAAVTNSPTNQPTIATTTTTTATTTTRPPPATCPLIGLCTSSSGDHYSVCSPYGNCPNGSLPDQNVNEGLACIEGDATQQGCQCCKRACSSDWLTSPCIAQNLDENLWPGYECVARGTCTTHFGGIVDSTRACTRQSAPSQCECCNLGVSRSIPAGQPAKTGICGGIRNVIDTATEVCDGTALGGVTCIALGYAGGTLSCASDCASYDARNCTQLGICCGATSNVCDNFPRTTEQQCTAQGGVFVAGAIQCTPRLCAAARSSIPPQSATQLTMPYDCGTATPIGSFECDDGGIGTLGGLVRSISNGTVYAVSNAHVWASAVRRSYVVDRCTSSRPPIVGQHLYQNNLPLTQPTSRLPVAHLTLRYSQQTPGSAALFDAAIGELTPQTHPLPLAPIQMGLGAQVGGAPAAPTLGMIVVKSGRTSGITVGQVIGVDVEIYVSGASDDGTDSYYVQRYTDQVLIRSVSSSRPFSQPGDSGSFVLEQQSMRTTALLFAGSTTLTVASPMQRVLDYAFPGGDGEIAAPSQQQRRKLDAARHEALRGEGGEKLEGSFLCQKFTGDSVRATNIRAEMQRARTQHREFTRYVRGRMHRLAQNVTIIAHYVSFSSVHNPRAEFHVLVKAADEDALRVARASLSPIYDEINVVVEHTLEEFELF